MSNAMKDSQLKLFPAIFASIFIACLSVSTQAIAQNARVLQGPEQTLNLASRSDKAKNIALDRYQFVKYLQTKFDLPFYTSSETSCTVLFPEGRSDRLYTLLWNGYWPSGTAKSKNLILCYQRTGGKVKLVWEIKLKARSVSAKTHKIRKLIDYLYAIGCIVRQKTDDYKNNDLTMPQDYVVYRYWVEENTLEVFLASDYKSGGVPNLSEEKRYNLDKDPLTKQELKQDEFYRRYGLPVAKKELSK